MKILKENLDDLFVKTRYIEKNQYSDIELNKLLNYWCLFEEKEMIIQRLTNESLEVILYSKFYWCSRYKEKYKKIYGIDVGIDQQQYKIIEELEQRLYNGIDWTIVQILEENKI